MAFHTDVWDDDILLEDNEPGVLLSLVETTEENGIEAEGEIASWKGKDLESVKDAACNDMLNKMLAASKRFHEEIQRLNDQVEAIRSA